jgi:hypothetical protein
MNVVNGTLEVIDAVIVSVEKGNMGNPNAERFVCAFNVCHPDIGTDIKVLLFNNYAKTIWNIIKDFKTQYKEGVVTGDKFNILQSTSTSVSFYAEIREIRKNVIVVQDPDRLVFNTQIEHSLLDDGDNNEDIQWD